MALKDEIAELTDGLKGYTSKIEERLSKLDAFIKNAELALDKMQKFVDKCEKTHVARVTELNESFKTMAAKVEAWEESLYYIFHNVKRNQFLYSHYPEEWVKNFQDLKAATLFENAYMDEKIANKPTKPS